MTTEDSLLDIAQYIETDAQVEISSTFLFQLAERLRKEYDKQLEDNQLDTKGLRGKKSRMHVDLTRGQYKALTFLVRYALSEHTNNGVFQRNVSYRMLEHLSHIFPEGKTNV